MSRIGLVEEKLTESVIGAFLEVYNQLGFGFVESVYSKALEVELRERGHRVDREVPVPGHYKGRFVFTLRSATEVLPRSFQKSFHVVSGRSGSSGQSGPLTDGQRSIDLRDVFQ